MVKIVQNYYSETHITVNLSQNTLHFEHAYPILFVTFWSISEIECLQMCYSGCLEVLNWLRTFTFYGHFHFGEEAAVSWCQIRWVRQMRTRYNISLDPECYKCYKCRMKYDRSRIKDLHVHKSAELTLLQWPWIKTIYRFNIIPIWILKTVLGVMVLGVLRKHTNFWGHVPVHSETLA